MTAVPPALPGRAWNKRLQESHKFTRLLLGKADMRVLSCAVLTGVTAPGYASTRDCGGMNEGSPARTRLAGGGNRIRTFGSPTDPLPLREQSASHDGLTVSRPGTEISNPSPSSGESVANSNLSAGHANVLAARDQEPTS